MTKESFFRTLFICLFLLFISFYIAVQAGYYEYKNNKQASLTVEQIMKFEQDIKDGKNVDIEDYLIEDNKNKKSKLSEFSTSISNAVEKYVKKSISFTFDTLGKLFNE